MKQEPGAIRKGIEAAVGNNDKRLDSCCSGKDFIRPLQRQYGSQSGARYEAESSATCVCWDAGGEVSQHCVAINSSHIKVTGQPHRSSNMVVRLH